MNRTVFAALAVVLAGVPALPAGAATVYLKDGAEIDCRSYRQDGDRVELLLDGGRHLSFSLVEIDTARTPDLAAVAEPEAEPAAAAEPPGLPEELAATVPFFGVRMPEDSADCAPALRDELQAVYGRYNRAAAAGDFGEVQRLLPAARAREMRDSLTGLTGAELQARRAALQESASRSFAVRGCLHSPAAGRAALAGHGLSMFKAGVMDAHGTVTFIKEPDGWKVRDSAWNPVM